MQLKSLIGNHKDEVADYPAHVAETLLMNGTHEPADDASRAIYDKQRQGRPGAAPAVPAAEPKAETVVGKRGKR